MFSAFFATRITYCGAYSSKFLDEWRVSGDGLFQVATHVGAFPVESYAFRHHFDIVFLKAGIEAAVALGHALMQRFKQMLVLLFHWKSPPDK